ncbi:hypothetical protein F5J12DRAFT_718201 [Pisolithus orientalis]|uniref:uncharacterized protein n=1 Tax=Pisolithus orientalis TaxID=936130 RepID=UPI0022244B99|nr:uncharacterized protein F5J12DRAFT_718201 [Pisolithus orientalis]KAI6012414.1 hypothetical protein F5J12DRAFT_718201 [Pisolithus orientalis]
MSLSDLGKNDVSAEMQAIKDKLASQDTENAGLRALLMRREAELNEIKASLNETLHKLSKEADRALRLEGALADRDTELRTERVSRENVEHSLIATQEKFKAQERTTKELEATMDTLSQHSQSTNAERRALENEKLALQNRVRELQIIFQQHEAQAASSRLPKRGGRRRSSSLTNHRSPNLDQELNDCKEDLVKAENMRISAEKASQKKVSELLATLEAKEEEFEALKGGGTDGDAREREAALLQRIDEDEAKIAALESMLKGNQANGVNQAAYNKLQSRLKAESERLHRCEDSRAQLLAERRELHEERGTIRQELSRSNELLQETQRLLRDSQCKQIFSRDFRLLGIRQLQAQVETSENWKERESEQKIHNAMDIDDAPGSDVGRRSTHVSESAVASHIETLLHAIDRLRNERDEVKRALEFSEVEYRITVQGYQNQIASLSKEVSERPAQVLTAPSVSNHGNTEVQIRQLIKCATAFSIVITNLQNALESSEQRIWSLRSDKDVLNSRLVDLNQLVQQRGHVLEGAEQEQRVLLSKLDALSAEVSTSEHQRTQALSLVAELERKVQSLEESNAETETAYKHAHEGFAEAKERLSELSKTYEVVESERNSLSLQVANLQDDLARAQDELAASQDRYNALRTQQLNDMSTSEMTRALKDHIQELELRVLRRTEQIGIHQHDIHRLETNMKLQEERIAEMTSELEVLGAQKEAMVEDCAEARESRDRAIQKLEAAEEDIERLEELLDQMKRDSEAQLATMSSEVGRLTSERCELVSGAESTEGRIAALELANAEFQVEIQSLKTERTVIDGNLNTATNQFEELKAETHAKDLEIQQAFVALATLHRSWRTSAQQLQTASGSASSLQSQIDTLSQELLSRRRHADDVQEEVHVLRSQLTDFEAASEAATKINEVRETEINKLRSKVLREGRKEIDDACRLLRVELEDARAKAHSSQQNHTSLLERHETTMNELSLAKQDLEDKLTSTEERLNALHAEHQQSVLALEKKHRTESDSLSAQLDDRLRELEALRRQLEAETDARKRAETLFEQEIKAVIAQSRQQLDELRSEVMVLQDERNALQEQITNLEAETQRLHSLTRHLESRNRESESTCVTLQNALQECQMNLAQSEKAGKAAELSLVLQATQHEKMAAAFRHQLTSLQSGPDLHAALVESEEKNREMDDLLRAKCAEIEGYDDRILETLKANKKLTSKVETLTRKVQTLQTKLASTKSQNPQIASPRTSSMMPTPQQAGETSSPPQLHATPKMTMSLTPRMTSTHDHRATFAPSAVPETAGNVATIVAGMKRRAPDDDERDSVPPEGHYAADILMRDTSTPHSRRTLHTKQTGFTPSRSTRPRGGHPSPARHATTAVTPSHTITDVTNSPRTSSHSESQVGKKRSWLGKVRSNSASQNNSVTVPAKPWTSHSSEFTKNKLS